MSANTQRQRVPTDARHLARDARRTGGLPAGGPVAIHAGGPSGPPEHPQPDPSPLPAGDPFNPGQPPQPELPPVSPHSPSLPQPQMGVRPAV